MTKQPEKDQQPDLAECFAGCGNRDFDEQGRAQRAAETAHWQTAVRGSFTRRETQSLPDLGEGVHRTSTFGVPARDPLLRMADLGQRAQQVRLGGDLVSQHFDPDTKEAEDRRLGPSITVARYPHN